MDDLDYGATIKGFNPGQKVFNRYVLNKILGRGGMGVVWLAKDEELGRETALKFLPEVVAMDPSAIGDLKREVRRAIELAHPHIVKIHDFVTDGRTAAVSMEYVTGQTLSSQRLDEPGQVFTVEKIGPWVSQLCSALDYAHQDAEVVHRDLKPTNLMIDGRGRLKVLDFGIAASISDSVSRVSNKGSTSGTPVYMSPQQMMGEDPAITDDVYALGATLFELLAGKPPFNAGNIVLQVQNKVAPLLNDRRKAGGLAPVPVEWEQVVAACLAKDPKERPQSAGELAQRLGVGTASTWKKSAPPVLSPPPAVASAPAAPPQAAAPAAAGSAPSKAAYYVWRPALWAMGISFVVVGLGGLIIGSDSSNNSISFGEKLGLTVVVGCIASFCLWLLLMFVRLVFTKGPQSGPAAAKPKTSWLRAALLATVVPTLVGIVSVPVPILRFRTDSGTVLVGGGLIFLVVWFLHTFFYAMAQGVLLASKTRNIWPFVLTPAVIGAAVNFCFYTAVPDFKLSDADLATGVLAVATVWGLAGWISHRMLVKDRPAPGPQRRWWLAGAAVALLFAANFFFVAMPNHVMLALYREKQAELRVAEEAAQKEKARLAAEEAAKKLEAEQKKKEAEATVQAASKMVFDHAPDQGELDAYVQRMLADPAYDATRVRHEMRASPQGRKGGRVLVPAEFKTIQDAINEAVPGNIVLVGAGTYAEGLYLDKAIDLIGAGREAVTVESAPSGTALYATKNASGKVTGFTFRHTGTTEDERRTGVVTLGGGSVQLMGNTITDSNGHGITLRGGGGKCRVESNLVKNSRWSGICVYEKTSGVIGQNEVRNNEQNGLTVDDESPELTVTANEFSANGHSGITLSNGNNVRLTDNRVTNNCTRKEYYGIAIYAGRPVLSGNQADGNRPDDIWWVSDKAAPIILSGNVSRGKTLAPSR